MVTGRTGHGPDAVADGSAMTSEFAGKVAVVTGGTAGIGRATAQLLAERGGAVAVCGVADAEVDQVLGELNAVGPGRVRGETVDVRDEKAVASFVERTVAEFGGIDMLVCSAGIQRYGTVETTTSETWDEVLDINLKGAFLAARHALPHMRERGSGSIVNVSSIQAFVSQTEVAAYTVSKAGLNALTRSIAVDYAPLNIRANAVCPASVDTPMLRQAAALAAGDDAVEQTIDEWGRTHPLGRVGKTDEVAEAVAYLLSDRASFITGAELRIDGGALAVNPISPLK